MFGTKTITVLSVAVSLLVPATALATAPVNEAAFPPLSDAQHCNKAGAKIGILLCSWPSLRALVIKGHADVRGGTLIIEAECGNAQNSAAVAVTSGPLGKRFTYKQVIGDGVDCNVKITLKPLKAGIAINGVKQKNVPHMYVDSISASYTRR